MQHFSLGFNVLQMPHELVYSFISKISEIELLLKIGYPPQVSSLESKKSVKTRMTCGMCIMVEGGDVLRKKLDRLL